MLSMPRSYIYSLVTFSTLLVANANAFEVGIGMHVRTYPNEPGYYLSKVKEAGFTSFREDYPWHLVETKKSVYANSQILNKVDTAFAMGSDKYGLSSVLILDYSNELYDPSGYPSTDAAIAAFANYSYWTAKRFKGKVKYFEIWNEWLYKTGVHVRSAVPPSPEVYAKLVAAVSKAVKRADPDAIVITGSFSPFSQRDVAWFDRLIDLGILNYIDGISLHTYTPSGSSGDIRTAEGNLQLIDAYQKHVTEKSGKQMPIYITEVGFPTYSGKDGLSSDKVAQYVMKYTLLASAKGYIKGVWWYDFMDDGNADNKKEHNFGFFKRNESPKESVSAIGTLSDFINNYSISNASKEKDGTNIITMKNNRSSKFATIYWRDEVLPEKSDLSRMIQNFKSSNDNEKVKFMNVYNGSVGYPNSSSTPTVIYSDGKSVSIK